MTTNNSKKEDTLFAVIKTGGKQYVVRNNDILDVEKLDEKDGDKYNVFDFGLTGGVSYYINSGLFFAIRMSYGLTDTTNDKMDVSLRSLTDDNRFIYTNDKDHHFGTEFSIGFRF